MSSGSVTDQEKNERLLNKFSVNRYLLHIFSFKTPILYTTCNKIEIKQ